MVEGNTLLHAGKPAEALERLEKSFTLVASPNTELLVARALRDLGRRIDATRAYEHAEAEARRREVGGEVKYGQTAAAAHTEGEALRAELGTLRVHLAKRGQVLHVDGKNVALAAEGDTSILHAPGRAEVVVREGETEQKQVVTVVAGATIQMEFGGTGATAASDTPKNLVGPFMTPTRIERPSSSWTTPTALVAGGVALAGAGTFAFFGLKSESTWSDLSERCGPSSCGPAERADADAAKREQTIANIGLAVASVAAVTTIAFLVIKLTSHDSSPAHARIENLDGRGGL